MLRCTHCCCERFAYMCSVHEQYGTNQQQQITAVWNGKIFDPE